MRIQPDRFQLCRMNRIGLVAELVHHVSEFPVARQNGYAERMTPDMSKEQIVTTILNLRERTQ